MFLAGGENDDVIKNSTSRGGGFERRRVRTNRFPCHKADGSGEVGPTAATRAWAHERHGPTEISHRHDGLNLRRLARGLDPRLDGEIILGCQQTVEGHRHFRIESVEIKRARSRLRRQGFQGGTENRVILGGDRGGAVVAQQGRLRSVSLHSAPFHFTPLHVSFIHSFIHYSFAVST